MDFKLVLDKLLTSFEQEGVQYALMGGFALGLWGVHRATVDIDFLVHRDDIAKVHNIMSGFGYKCILQTENVSQYISALSIFGEVDFIHAFREASTSMLKRSEERKIFEESLTIKVLRPEDLIGLKVQAMSNDKSRWNLDLADIEKIMQIHKKELDWSIIKEYFVLFGLGEMARELREKYCGPE